MRLSYIIEGFGLRPQYKEAEIAGYNIYYRPTDRADDLIKIQPVMQSTSLTKILDERYRLSNFDGTIYIGFEVVPANEYKDKEGRALSAPFRVIKSFNAGLNITIQGARSRSDQILTRINNGDEMRGDRAIAQAYKQIAAQATRLGIKDTTLLTSLDSAIFKHNKGRIHKLAYELAQKIKHCTKTGGAITEKFLELSASLVRRLPGRPHQYDYVVYPQSSSPFNKALAERIAAADGSIVQQINKLAAKDVKINWQQMHDTAVKMAPAKLKKDGPHKGMYEVGQGKNLRYWPDVQSFAKDWADNEYAKLHGEIDKQMKTAPDEPLEIKAVNLQDKRRYAKMFDPTGTQEIGELGESVLIIDDNAVSGSTSEQIYEIMINLDPKPQRIDIFIPLRLPSL